jgi:ABC-2 type transport system permease protein
MSGGSLMHREIRIILAEIEKVFKITFSYPIEVVAWVIFPLLWILPIVFQGKALAGSLQSGSFQKLTGTGEYIPFVLVGAIIGTYVFSAIYGMDDGLRTETYWGTLELIFASPARRISVLMGKALADTVFGTIYAVMQTCIFAVLFGLKISFGTLLPVLLAIVLLVLGLWGFSLAMAGLTLRIKESHGVIHGIENLLNMFSPMRYPVEITRITSIASLFVPLTYALAIARGVMLMNRPIATLWREAVILLIMDVLLIAGGLAVYSYYDHQVRKIGSVGHY